VDPTFVFFSSPPDTLAGLNFNHGYFSFNVTGAGAGGSVVVSMILPAGEAPVTYYKFGPTPDNTNPHWYEFLYDGETGAQINGNEITLNFVDGKRGDSDLDAGNGVIADPGGPAVAAPVTGASDSGSGCSLGGADGRPTQAGAWWLLLLMLVVMRLRRTLPECPQSTRGTLLVRRKSNMQ
jgi:MYXO-CTERM domain-containing protein